MAERQMLVLNVNGEQHSVKVDPATPLLFVLRNTLGLTAAKLGCGLEQCGACAVLVDGVSTLSCSAPVAGFVDRVIVTCEGLGSSAELSKVQQAFVSEGVGQCGYCVPGLVVAVTGLLDANPNPDESQIVAALQAHLCRCGSHSQVLRAVQRAVRVGA